MRSSDSRPPSVVAVLTFGGPAMWATAAEGPGWPRADNLTWVESLVDIAERHRSKRRIAVGIGVAGLVVSFVGLFGTLGELLRNFHDDEAAYLFPRTFWWITALVVSAVTVAAWRSQSDRSIGSLAARWLVTLVFAAVALWGGFLLLRPLDLGRYEAYCEPLVLETVGRSHPWDRCNDPGRFIGGVVLLVGGVIASAFVWSRSPRGPDVSDRPKP